MEACSCVCQAKHKKQATRSGMKAGARAQQRSKHNAAKVLSYHCLALLAMVSWQPLAQSRMHQPSQGTRSLAPWLTTAFVTSPPPTVVHVGDVRPFCR